MRHFLLFGLLMASTVAAAQSNEEFMNQTTRDKLNYTNVTSSITSSLFTIKGPAGKLLGDPYLDTTWQTGTVKFYNRIGTSLTTDSLSNIPVRIDLNANEVEVRAGAKDIRVVNVTAVLYVDIHTSNGKSRFMNVHEYQVEGNNLTGFFEQTATGKLQLLLHPSIYLRRANYNVAMNTGSKDDELLKKFDWYVAQGKQAKKFSPGKKALLELMADKKEPVEAYLKNEKPDLKTRSGLVSVFSYYNSL
ncbi:hypothetical protein WBJ53_20190 [Spirosoma sp. SC4-14]|uniref:hypothetical protein n=1 Tax=Spirosoma sp. SC4-14 TaxID=3128900 RepID=UPI0030CFD60C